MDEARTRRLPGDPRNAPSSMVQALLDTLAAIRELDRLRPRQGYGPMARTLQECILELDRGGEVPAALPALVRDLHEGLLREAWAEIGDEPPGRA